MCKRVHDSPRRGSHHNTVVKHPVSSFGMSGKRSYLPDTGSRARNNKRILGIEPARPSGTGAAWRGAARRSAPTAKRRRRGRERNKKKRRRGEGRKGRRGGGLVEGYDVLGLVRLFDVGRERVPCTSHPINLDPRFQIRFSPSFPSIFHR